MSDYYGEATLENWLAEEVFQTKNIPAEIVSQFEKWRTDIEMDIEKWLDSDDGYGNQLSWRDWGRGFALLSDEDYKEFEDLVYINLSKLDFCCILSTNSTTEEGIKNGN